MRKFLMAFGIALILTALFIVPVIAEGPPNNVGQQSKPIAREAPGAMAASVHHSQESAGLQEIPVGQLFKNYFEDQNLIPGHDPNFPYK